jgi:hypothetical protein
MADRKPKPIVVEASCGAHSPGNVEGREGKGGGGGEGGGGVVTVAGQKVTEAVSFDEHLTKNGTIPASIKQPIRTVTWTKYF